MPSELKSDKATTAFRLSVVLPVSTQKTPASSLINPSSYLGNYIVRPTAYDRQLARILTSFRPKSIVRDSSKFSTGMMRSVLRSALGRSRAGCQTCRKRRKGCDRVRPVCGACSRLKLKCTYSFVLKWGESRNIFVDQDEHSVVQQDTYDFSSSTVDTTTQVRLRSILEAIDASHDLQRTVFLTLSDQDREILLDCKRPILVFATPR